MKEIFILILFLSITVSAQKVNTNAQQNNLLEINFCDLLKDAENYRGKEVYIKATFSISFEQSELYCLSCLDIGKVWVEFDKSYKAYSNSKAVKRLKAKGYRGKTVNIEAVGIFYSGENYGHLGAYPYKFVIRDLKKAEVIATNGQSPNSLSENERKKLCQ